MKKLSLNKPLKALSSLAVATITPLRLATAAKAARVCITMGLPAITRYCLGAPAPARVPLPPQGMSAQIFGDF